MSTRALTSVSSAKVVAHVCANRELRKRATSWGIGERAIHADKMHYYLCTLINGENKHSINHVRSRGWGTGGAEARRRQGCERRGPPGLVFPRPEAPIRNGFVRLSGHATSPNLGWSWTIRPLFQVAIAPPAALSSRLLSERLPLSWKTSTCESSLFRLLLLPLVTLQTMVSLYVTFLFVWTEPWPAMPFVDYLKIPHQR